MSWPEGELPVQALARPLLSVQLATNESPHPPPKKQTNMKQTNIYL